jgi:dethiobiotin synthetase
VYGKSARLVFAGARQMTAVFIAATGTDIGKTFVTCGLIRAWRAQGRQVEALKPVASGFDPHAALASDTGMLLAALGRDITDDTIAAVSPWRFAAPLSPHLAARAEGRPIDFAELVAFCRARIAQAPDVLAIEGVGGLMVPLDDAHTVLDWMVALDLPVVLVTGSYLGTFSHTLTALDVLDRRKLSLAALVVSESVGSTVSLGDTVATLRRFAPGTHVFALPRRAEGASDKVFAEIAGKL